MEVSHELLAVLICAIYSSTANEQQICYRTADVPIEYLHRLADNGEIKNIISNYTMKRRETYTTAPKFMFPPLWVAKEMENTIANDSMQVGYMFNVSNDIYGNEDKIYNNFLNVNKENDDIKENSYIKVTNESDGQVNKTKKEIVNITYTESGKGDMHNMFINSGKIDTHNTYMETGKGDMLNTYVDSGKDDTLLQLTNRIEVQSDHSKLSNEIEPTKRPRYFGKNQIEKILQDLDNTSIESNETIHEYTEVNDIRETTKTIKPFINDSLHHSNKSKKHHNKTTVQRADGSDEYGNLAKVMETQQQLLVKLGHILRDDEATSAPDEFDKIMASVEFKRTSVVDTTNTTTTTPAAKVVIGQTDVRKALRNDPFIKRILRIAKRRNHILKSVSGKPAKGKGKF